MIQADELMKGSLVKTNYDAHIYKVWEIRRSGLELDSKIGDCHIHSISFDSCLPIPITEEWLLDFGFEILTDKTKGFKSNSYTYTKGISFIVHLNDELLSVNFWQGNEKKYVHQLQNLFFVLTGKKLELNQ